MGATNTTTYYNLSQFIGTDKPAWLQDYNGDMLKIDSGIHAAKIAADNAANAASAAQGDATTALGDIASLNNTVGTISNTLNTAVGAINTITALLGNGTPTTTDQTIIGAINEINSNLSGVKTLLNGTHVLNSELSFIVTTDGVKNFQDLQKELADQIVAYAQNMSDSDLLEIDYIGGSAIGKPQKIDRSEFINNQIASLDVYFNLAYTDGTDYAIKSTQLNTTLSANHSYGMTNGTVTSYDALVLPAGSELIARVLYFSIA